MKDKEYFASFDESQYEEEAQQRWGSTTQYRESQRKWSSYTKSQKEAIKAEGGHLAIRMVTESQSASRMIRMYKLLWVNISTILTLISTIVTWNSSVIWLICGWKIPVLLINYERIREGGAAFVRDAVHIYCDKNA